MPYEPKRLPLDPCPVEEVLAIVAGKWKARVILLLSLRSHGFADLRRALPGVTQQVLSTQLLALARDGIVSRECGSGAANESGRYGLTPDGRALMPALEAVAALGDSRLRARGLTWDRPGPGPAAANAADTSGHDICGPDP